MTVALPPTVPTLPSQRPVIVRQEPRNRTLLLVAMLVSIGTALAVVAAIGGRVGDAISVTAPPPTAVAPAAPVDDVPQDMQNVEAAYLAAVHGAGLGAYGTDAELTELGYTICEGWPSGMTFADLVHALVARGWALDDAGAGVGISTAAFCSTFADGIPG